MPMPAADREKARRWTANQVRQLITDSPLATPRYELVDGELLVTPSPVGQHQRAVALLLHALLAYLEQYPVAAAFSSPSDVELEHGTIVQPDVYVVPLHEARRILNQSPVRELLVAAEVISPSSRRFDRGTKRLLYGRHVPEYWIVDLDARTLEEYELVSGAYVNRGTVPFDQPFTPRLFPGLAIDLAALAT